MATSAERTVRQSVLDRLIDESPGSARDPAISWGESVAELKQSVLRDLESLLNTRRIAEPVPDALVELQRSVYNYGLPDLTSLSGDSTLVRQRVLRQVEDTIRQFEPRLTGVRVSVREGDAEAPRRIRFVIEAMLRMEPDPEPVAFDSVLEITSGVFRIAGESDA